MFDLPTKQIGPQRVLTGKHVPSPGGRGRLKLSVLVIGLTLLTACAPAVRPAVQREAAPPSPGYLLVADGLGPPVAMVAAPDGSGRLFIAEQTGRIVILTPEGTIHREAFLDLTDRMLELSFERRDERGLLGLAFHPQFASNGRTFVYYSAPGGHGMDHVGRLSEFTVSAGDLNIADPQSERIILEIEQPRFSHNGGQILFGPDGYLYWAVGDGGGRGDPFQNGQNPDTLLGSVLRLGVDTREPYGIPSDNPFADRPGRDEIYAYGFRNPYRFSFDFGGDGSLYLADAGQSLYEEVDRVVSGGNYGWNIREGAHCYDQETEGELPDCPRAGPFGEPLIDPLLEYGRQMGRAIVGVYLYRGSGLPELQSRLVIADWTGSVYQAAKSGDDGGWAISALYPAPGQPEDPNRPLFVLSLATDQDGELYLLTSDSISPAEESGRVYKLIESPPDSH